MKKKKINTLFNIGKAYNACCPFLEVRKVRKVRCMMLIMTMTAFVCLTACGRSEDSAEDNGFEVIAERLPDVSEQSEPENKIPEGESLTPGGSDTMPEEIAGSPEYQACKEWVEFWETYDTNGEIISAIGNDDVNIGREYEEAYGCYTQEMADKVDEICGKYSLSKLTGFQYAEGYSDLCDKTGTGDFLGNPSRNAKLDCYGGYFYTDGTFHVEGNAVLGEPLLCVTDFQLTRIMKGSFSTVLDNKAFAGDDVQKYMTEKGETVFLVRNGAKTLIVAERENSFVQINVLGHGEGNDPQMSDEILEGLAEAFDFSVIP